MPFIYELEEVTFILLSLSPEDGAEGADLSPVEIIWQALDPTGNPLDDTSYRVERDGIEQALSYTHLGGGQVKVSSDVGIFPDEFVSLLIRAATMDGVEIIYPWSFSSRIGTQGESISSANLQNGAVSQSLMDLAYLLSGSLDSLADLTLRDFGIYAQEIVDFARFNLGSIEQILTLKPVFSYAGEIGLAQALTGYLTLEDIGLARFTRTEVMDPQACLLSLELGIIQEPLSALTSFETKGLPRTQLFILSLLVSGPIGMSQGGAGSLELAKVVLTDPFGLGLEIGLPVDGTYPVSITLQRGQGALIFLDLLSQVLAKLRE